MVSADDSDLPVWFRTTLRFSRRSDATGWEGAPLDVSLPAMPLTAFLDGDGVPQSDT